MTPCSPFLFTGAGWQMTIKFAIEVPDSYADPVDYRTLTATQHGTLFKGENIATCQRVDTTKGEPRRVAGPIRDPSSRLELYKYITDDQSEAIAANYTPRIEALKEDVEALYNNFLISYEDLQHTNLNKSLATCQVRLSWLIGSIPSYH